MLSREENELITRVGPGTPMGNAMRRYWIPACLSREIAEPDGAPVRVRLLGEDLVAFRDTEGRIGLVDEFCPHRRVSLYFGRNEECGLRCVYHGWKFDVDGACVDQLNEPAEYEFKHKVRLDAYPTCELGGIVWAYLGPADKMPPLPKFAWTQVPEARRHVTKVIEECNWLQALEGGIDTSHAPILHRLLTDSSKRGGIKPSNPFVRGKAPKLVVDVTDYGYLYAGIRPLGDARCHIRTYHFIMPFHQIRPSRSESGLRPTPATSGCRWMTTTAWSTTGCYSHRRPADRRGPARARPRQRAAACRSEDLPLQAEPLQQLRARPRRAADRELLRHRRHQPAGPRAAGEHGPRSSTARRSIWARPTRRSSRRASCCARR